MINVRANEIPGGSYVMLSSRLFPYITDRYKIKRQGGGDKRRVYQTLQSKKTNLHMLLASI